MATGLLLFLALPPHDLWWVAWWALVPLLLAIDGCAPKHAAMLGLLSGTVANYGAFYWVTELIDQFSKLGPLRFVIMGIMAVTQGVPLLLWALLLRRRSYLHRGGGLKAFALVVTAWSLPAIEYFYPIIFPWYLANTQHSQPALTGVVDLGGCALLSLAIVTVNLALARLLLSASEAAPGQPLWPCPAGAGGKGLAALLAVLVPALCWGYSFARNRQIRALQEQAPKLRIGLVQPDHWINDAGPLETLHDYQVMSLKLVEEAQAAGKPLDLLMWPESAVRTQAPRFLSKRGPSNDNEAVRLPMDLVQVFRGYSRPADELELERGVPGWELLSIQRGHQVPVLFGSTLQDCSPGARGPMPNIPPLYNCGVLIDSEGKVVGIAPKVKLLLFGETIPGSGLFPQVYDILPLASALLPGKKPTLIDFGKAKIGMMICYEDLLPWFHYELAQDHPNVLLNLTNDAWFGKTAEAPSHLALAKLRAVEGRVPLVRSTSTGISAFVDATGEVTAEIGMDKRAAISHEVALLDVQTLFERWGDWVAWLGLVLLAVHLVLGRRFAGRSEPADA